MQCRYCTRNEDYLVFADGNIYSRKSQKMLKPEKNTHGYYQVNLCKDGKVYHVSIHRLVAEVFIPNPDNKPEVNHINGIKTDNRVENLEWATSSENCTHAVRIKLHTYESTSKAVMQYTKTGDLITIYSSASEASRETGINQGNISAVCRGKYGYKSAGGYIWRYVDEGP